MPMTPEEHREASRRGAQAYWDKIGRKPAPPMTAHQWWFSLTDDQRERVRERVTSQPPPGVAP
jgi:hypothetical protein